jgi:4-amino-4-deoxy-L-arabinose transferase-like glycosyltransferase
MSAPIMRSDATVGTPQHGVVDSIKAAFARQPVVWLAAILVCLVHAATAGRYDAQRNELYFLACGWHPDFGYVDQPPLVPLIAAATQIFGVSIWLLRLPATLAAIGLVFLCAAFVRLLGGGNRAASFAAIASGIAPGLAGLMSHLTTSTFEPIAWTAATFLLTRAIRNDRHSDMIWIGLLTGVAMEAKWGIAVWLIALAVGVIVGPARRILLWWQLWLGLVIAAALTAPNLIWQWWHGWPFFEVILPHLESQKNFTGPLWQFEWRQALSMNLALAPLWLVGAIAPFFDRRLADARFLSLAFALTTAFYFLKHGTNYYLFPVYPTMFAVGAAWAERLDLWVTRGWTVVALGVSALFAPVALPILDPTRLAGYMELTHTRPEPIEAAGVGAPLTQSLSDEFGWRELEDKVATVFRGLSAEDQVRAAILASNYGQAAALDVYGAKDHLPPALSGHNQYWLWGPRGYDGSLIIHIGGDPERWRRLCGTVDIVDHTRDVYAMPYENDRAIFVCRRLRIPLAQLWDKLKRFR